MAIKITDDAYYADIASAIREKTGGEERLKPAEMAPALRSATLNELIVTPSTEVQTFEAECPCIGFKRVTVEAAEYATGGGGGGEIVELEPAEDALFGYDYERVPEGTVTIGEWKLPAIPERYLKMKGYPYWVITWNEFTDTSELNSSEYDDYPWSRFTLYASSKEFVYRGYSEAYGAAHIGTWAGAVSSTTAPVTPSTELIYYSKEPNGDNMLPLDEHHIYNVEFVPLWHSSTPGKTWVYQWWKKNETQENMREETDLNRSIYTNAFWANHDIYYKVREDEALASGLTPFYKAVPIDKGYVLGSPSYEVQGDTMNELLGGIQNIAGSEEPMSPDEASDFINSYVPPEIQPEATVTPSLSEQTVLPEEGFDGIAKVVVEATPLEDTTVTPTAEGQEILPPEGILGFKKITVDPIPLQEKTAWPTAWTDVVVEADGEYAGLSKVTVKPAPMEELTVTPTAEVQEFLPSDDHLGFSRVVVNAAVGGDPPVLEEITITPSNEVQVILPSEGYHYISKVTVLAAPSGGSGVPSAMGVGF